VASYQQLEVGVQSSVHTAASQLEAYDAILDVAAMEHALGKGWTLRLSPLACTRGKLIRGEQSPRRKSSHGTSNLGTTATANFALEGPRAGGAGTRSGRRSSTRLCWTMHWLSTWHRADSCGATGMELK
jgi:hypothetical protein